MGSLQWLAAQEGTGRMGELLPRLRYCGRTHSSTKRRASRSTGKGDRFVSITRISVRGNVLPKHAKCYGGGKERKVRLRTKRLNSIEWESSRSGRWDGSRRCPCTDSCGGREVTKALGPNGDENVPEGTQKVTCEHIEKRARRRAGLKRARGKADRPGGAGPKVGA